MGKWLLSDCEEWEGAGEMGRVVPAPNTKTGLPEALSTLNDDRFAPAPCLQWSRFFPSSLVRLSVLVFQPPPTLSGHRSMFTLAPQPEIW